MDVVSVCPLKVASVEWMPREGAHALTVVAKATFDLVPGKAPLSEVQDAPNSLDHHWMDDASRSVYAPSNLAPFKPRADVVLVGDAFAPGGNPTRSLVARLMVGSIEKSVEVSCDRFYDNNDELGEADPFTRMPLRYERTAGGAHSSNPVGVDMEGKRDRFGRLMLPNLVRPGTVPSRNGTFEVRAFGPISSTWSTRRVLLGRHALDWSDEAWLNSPMPTDIDGAFFQSSPLDQRLDELRDNERITLENMHADEPRVVCHLPGIKPVAFVEQAGAVRDLRLRADTLWIDTNRQVLTVTWRGRVDLNGPREAGRVHVAMSENGSAVDWADVKKLAALNAIRDEETSDGALSRPRPGLPFAKKDRLLTEETAVGVPVFPGADPVLAVQRLLHKDDQSPAWLRDTQSPGHQSPAHKSPAHKSPAHKSPAHKSQPPALTQVELEPPQRLDSTMGYGGVASPWVAAAGAPVQARSRPPAPNADPSHHPSPQGSQGGAALPKMPPPAPPPAPPAVPSGPPPPVPPPPPPPPATASASSPPARASSPAMPLMPEPSPVGVPINIRPPNPVEALNAQQRADASYDDVAPVAMHDRLVRQSASEVVEVLWYDADCVHKVRARPGWGEHIRESDRKIDKLDDPLDFDDELPEQEDAQVRDRRHIVAVMTRGHVTSDASLPHAMADAVDATGNFEPPLVIMSGRLHFPFDELKILKATLAAVTPLIAGNKDLGDTVDAVNELMSTPWLEEGSGEVASKLTDRVREAFKRGDRLIDPSYLDDHTDRILLEQRCYSMRSVFGDEYIRALFAPSAGRTRIPCYIPVSLKKELPMFKSLPARVIAEAHVAQDQFEAHEYALRVIALGRVVQVHR